MNHIKINEQLLKNNLNEKQYKKVIRSLNVYCLRINKILSSNIDDKNKFHLLDIMYKFINNEYYFNKYIEENKMSFVFLLFKTIKNKKIDDYKKNLSNNTIN